MEDDVIKIRGARVHNLKNIDIDIPRNKLVVITGISGSGKSSLAFDTLYAEGQRRYIESLSTYARQFLGVMDKPDVGKIEGISPAISIDQRKSSHNPRSTVGTITEIYDYLRLLFSKIGKPHCPKCGKLISRQTIDQIMKQILKLPKNSKITILAPTDRSLEKIKGAGFVRVRVDGFIYFVDKPPTFLEKVGGKAPERNHNIEIVIDELIINRNVDKLRLKDSLEIALRIGKNIVIINDSIFNTHYTCQKCRISLPELEPRLFSFNNPYGICSECTGLGEKLEIDPELLILNKNLTLAEGALRDFCSWNQSGIPLDQPVGKLSKKVIDIIIAQLEKKYRETKSDWLRKEIEQYMVAKKCPKCLGKRLKPEVLAVTINNKSIDQIVEMSIDKAKNWFERSDFGQAVVSKPIVKEVIAHLQFLIDVGLDYLTLDRKVSTLAGGEEQRIRLATQIGSKLRGVLYVLDEPSIGLHPRDQRKLIETIKKLRDLGNTIVLVEHDPQTIRAADWIIDIGPGAGKQGGKVIFTGTPKHLLKSKTLTGEYLSGRKKVEIKSFIPSANNNYLIIKGATENNLKNINVKIPLGKFVCVTGVSGSGKSSLVDEILARALLQKFYRAKEKPGRYKEILGTEFLNKVVLINQSAIGRTPRSNPATYTGTFSYIRDLFSETKEARIKKYNSGRFSFNVKGGRCEACEGQGQIKVEMYFLADVYIECEECKGKRYNKEALEIEYKGKNIAEVLKMTVEEGMDFFKNTPGLFEKLKTLKEVGLSYIELGQPAPSLSGGEAQRIKLATELSKKATGKTLYILDEPTTGLHPDDIKKLVKILRELVDKGNTVLTIEHNIDVVKNTDWVLDLGPEGGDKGGYIVAEGRPGEIAKNKKSYTGRYLTGF